MPAEDVLAQGLGVEGFGFDIVTGKAVFGMGDQDAAVGGAFHGAEDAGAGRGAGEADVEEAFEGAAGFAVYVGGFGEAVFAIGFFDAGEVFVEVKLFEGAAGDEEAGGVGGGPVCEAVFDAVGGEFVGVCGAEDFAVVGN